MLVAIACRADKPPPPAPVTTPVAMQRVADAAAPRVAPVPDAAPVRPPSVFDERCAGLAEATRQYDAAMKPVFDACAKDPSACPGDVPGPPVCHVDLVAISSPAPPWREVGLLTDLSDSGSHVGKIELLVRANDDILSGDLVAIDGLPVDVEHAAAKVERGKLVVEYDARSANQTTHHRVTCKATPTPDCEVAP